MYDQSPIAWGKGDFDLVVTGPRRSMIQASKFRSYFPAPYGDMMITGCFGMLSAAADLLPDYHDEILSALYRQNPTGIAPWDFDDFDK